MPPWKLPCHILTMDFQAGHSCWRLKVGCLAWLGISNVACSKSRHERGTTPKTQWFSVVCHNLHSIFPIKIKKIGYCTHTITHTYYCVQYILYSILGPTINQHIPYRFNLRLQLIFRSLDGHLCKYVIPNYPKSFIETATNLRILNSWIGPWTEELRFGVPKCVVCCRIISNCVDNCRSFTKCYHIQLPFFCQVRLH